MKERKLKIKLLKMLRDGYTTYPEIASMLNTKNKKVLQAMVDVINELYNERMILPVNFGDEKGLILLKK